MINLVIFELEVECRIEPEWIGESHSHVQGGPKRLLGGDLKLSHLVTTNFELGL